MIRNMMTMKMKNNNKNLKPQKNKKFKKRKTKKHHRIKTVKKKKTTDQFITIIFI